MADPIAQLDRFGAFLDKGPITAVATIFIVAFFWLLRHLFKREKELAAEIAALNQVLRADAIALQQASATMMAYLAMKTARRQAEPKESTRAAEKG